ncbi:amidase [Pseudarthrobacter siccitolerans]|uniref:amidase n=1 Tax=Pseudarthrobacter siccitolerans TaxID=861266 RepID=UPI0027B8F5CA|nr:amidase [Pseudarthrobacter siccitolerans]
MDVLEHFIERIGKLESTLHAFDVLDLEGARKQAKDADEAVRYGHPLGLLHGIPIGVMDAVKVKGLPNHVWHSQEEQHDDLSVERLRNAGAVIVGLTATYFWDPNERPRNPWDLTKDPGNSSRGSAIAVSAGMLPLALAEDGAGSTRLPASWCGVLGLSPGRGLIPYIDYQKPGFALTVTNGPIARNARDAAIMLQALAGPDGRDFTSIQADPPNYLERIEEGANGVKLAWTDDFGWSRSQWVPETPAIVEFARESVFGMAEVGAEVIETREVWEDIRPAMFQLGVIMKGMGYEPPIDASEISEMKKRIDEVWGLAEDASVPFALPGGVESVENSFELASKTREQAWRTLRNVLDENDALVSITTPLPPQDLYRWGMSGRDLTMTSYSAHTAMFNFLGFPAYSVPIGLLNGLPVGIQIASKPGKEDLLLRLAGAIMDKYPLKERPAVAL